MLNKNITKNPLYTKSNFCCEYAKDLISIPVDEKYEMIIKNDHNFENRHVITTVVT